MQTIGSRLKAERDRIGLSQNDICNLTGVSRKSLFNYENDERSPDAEFLSILEKNGFDIGFIICGKVSGDISVSSESIRNAAETTYKMVMNSDIQISAQQFSQMLMTLLQTETDLYAKDLHKEKDSSRSAHNQTATGKNIVQVGGHIKQSKKIIK